MKDIKKLLAGVVLFDPTMSPNFCDSDTKEKNRKSNLKVDLKYKYGALQQFH